MSKNALCNFISSAITSNASSLFANKRIELKTLTNGTLYYLINLSLNEQIKVALEKYKPVHTKSQKEQKKELKNLASRQRLILDELIAYTEEEAEASISTDEIKQLNGFPSLQ